jgi:hypothetical protein
MWEIESDGHMPECGALWIEKFLVDRMEEAEVVLFYRFPQLSRIFLAKEHYSLAGPSAKIVSLYCISLER